MKAARSLLDEPVPPWRGFSPVESEKTTPLATTGGSGTDMDSEIHMGISDGFSFSTPNWKAMSCGAIPENDVPALTGLTLEQVKSAAPPTGRDRRSALALSGANDRTQSQLPIVSGPIRAWS